MGKDPPGDRVERGVGFNEFELRGTRISAWAQNDGATPGNEPDEDKIKEPSAGHGNFQRVESFYECRDVRFKHPGTSIYQNSIVSRFSPLCGQ